MGEFVAFPKIARLNRDIVITEKIDGTNAAVVVGEDGSVSAQSRSRILSPGKATDNFGFAAWVEANKEALAGLGPGHHYGEWYGQGIQRTYGLTTRRFALFNVLRWFVDEGQKAVFDAVAEKVPGLELVPMLYRGSRFFSMPNAAGGTCSIDHWDAPTRCINLLKTMGSQIAPGYEHPEGIVVLHLASKQLYKVTVESDDAPKSVRG